MPEPALDLIIPPPWVDYELVDSGGGQKLERFGPYRLVRPESQAIWQPALGPVDWDNADALFEKAPGDNRPGQWQVRRSLPEQWPLHYNNLTFLARLTPFRHTGIFPEQGAHWHWLLERLRGRHQAEVLVLFGYTGLSTLIAAQAGASVCHVDASRPAIRWAQENQAASGLTERPIRWIVDDALKFVRREQRRGRRYDLIMMDPPVFGRGPKGEVWRLTEMLPELLAATVALLSDEPAGFVLNAYATNISALSLFNVVQAALQAYHGTVAAGELVLTDTTAQRPLSAAIYARWSRT